MKFHLTVLFILIALPLCQAKENNLIENGDFGSSRFKYWHVGVTKKYGQKLEYKVRNKAINFHKIKGSAPKYVTLHQFVKIEKEKKYRISFEAKIAEGTTGKANYSIGRPGFARTRSDVKGYGHLKAQPIDLETEWTTVTHEFTGGYKTDNKDYRGKNYNTAELKKLWRELEKNSVSPDAPTWLIFNVGAISGDLSIRKVQLVEVK